MNHSVPVARAQRVILIMNIISTQLGRRKKFVEEGDVAQSILLVHRP